MWAVVAGGPGAAAMVGTSAYITIIPNMSEKKKKTPNPNINFAMGTDSKYNITTRYYKPDVSVISYLLARDGVDVKPDADDDRRGIYAVVYRTYIVHFYLILVCVLSAECCACSIVAPPPTESCVGGASLNLRGDTEWALKMP